MCVLLAGFIVSLIVYAKHRDSSKKDTATPTDASTEAEAETESEEPATASTTEAETTTEEAEEIPEDIGFSYGKLQHTTFIFQVEQGHGRQICPLMQMGISQVCFMIARWEIPEKDIQVDQSILVNSSDGLDS